MKPYNPGAAICAHRHLHRCNSCLSGSASRIQQPFTGFSRTLASTLLCLFIELFPGQASANDAGNEITEPGVLEEIVVTATRREASLMSVAMTLSAFDGEQLELTGTPDLTYISLLTPNTTLEPTPGTNTTLTAYIRGVGQQDINAGFSTGVGMYLDDVYLNRPQAAILDIYQLERIEVLRGPQGTLYGRNSIGGAIRYITRPLPDNPVLDTRFSWGSDQLREAVINASAPISASLRAGGTMAYFGRDGFGWNHYLQRDNYDKDLFAMRGSLEWDASDDLSFRLAADITRDDSHARAGHRQVPGNWSGSPVLDDVFDSFAGLNNPVQSVEASGVSLVAQYQVNDNLLLKSISAYREDETWSPWDFDSLPWADMDLPLYFKNDQTSQEVQLLLSGESWSGVMGIYWLDARAQQAYDVLLAITGAIIGRPGLNAHTLGDVSTRSWSMFADFTREITENWSVSLGGRQTSDTIESTVLRQTMLGGTSPFFGGKAFPVATTSDFHGQETFSKFTPRLVLDWHPASNRTWYASYSEGFKAGGFDPRGQTSEAPDTDGDGEVSEAEIFEFMKFKPETVQSYELGFKATLLEGAMQSRLAVFHADYKDVQIPGSVSVDSDGDGVIDQFIGITTNAAKARIQGIEWEGTALLTKDIGRNGSDLLLNWAVGYIDAKFLEFIDDEGQDVASERKFRNTPDWTAALSLIYSTPLQIMGSGGSLAVINSLAYRGDTVQTESPSPELDQRAFTLWDLSLVWSHESGRWDIGLHGKNLGDQEYITSGFYAPDLGQERNITAFYGNPRQAWVTVNYHWN